MSTALKILCEGDREDCSTLYDQGAARSVGEVAEFDGG
jgi:hypothetical protein